MAVLVSGQAALSGVAHADQEAAVGGGPPASQGEEVAQEPPGPPEPEGRIGPREPLDLAGAERVALEANPRVRALRLRHEGTLERPAQEGALPDPMLSYTFMFEDVVTANGAIMDTVELSQEIPFRGKRPLRAGVSRFEAEAAEQAWRAARLEVLFEVRNAYYDLFRIDQSIAIVEEEAGVLDSLEQVARGRYAAGLVSQGDVLRAQTERSKIEERLLLLREERDAAVARFNAALNRPQTTPVGPALEPPDRAEDLPPQEALYDMARAVRPEVDEARRLVEAGRLREKLARLEFYPDFKVALQWNRIDPTANPFAPDSGQDATMVMVGVSLPIWRDKLRAGVREASAMTQAAEKEVRERGNLAESEVRAVLASVRAQRSLVALYESTLIPQAEATLRATEAAYQAGKLDFLSVLDSERSLLGIRLGRVMAEGHLGVAVGALERAVGRDLEEIRSLAAADAPAESST